MLALTAVLGAWIWLRLRPAQLCELAA